MAGTVGARFAFVVLWILSGGVQYGYHIAALNSSQDSIMCLPGVQQLTGVFSLPTCIQMTSFDFGIVTSAFTIGGFISSVNAGRLADGVGRKLTQVYMAGLIALGTAAIAFGSSMTLLVAGRFLIGIACGVETVVVSLFLSEVTPPALKSSVGIMVQLFICIGIFLAQSVSIPLSRMETGNWRYVPLVSAAIAIAQILTSVIMIESPIWLAEQTKSTYTSVRTDTIPVESPDERDMEAESPLLSSSAPSSATTSTSSQTENFMTLPEVVKSKDPAVKRGVRVIVLSQFFQQASGINAVMYYSTGILSTVSPSKAKYVSLFVTLVNVFMTFVPIYLIDRLGRRTLLMISLGSMSISSLVLAYSINNSYFLLAAIFIVMFVATFSIGLGPIPFLLIGEIPPVHARAATASVGLGTNWGSNSIIGLLFLPLRDFLSGGRDDGMGTVFYIFFAVSAVGTVVMGRILQ